MDYISPIVNDIAWHHSVEKLFDIDLTPRCKVIRTILCELGLISTELAQAEIEAQTTEVLVDVLGWGRGTLRVEALDPSESDNAVFIDQSVETMLVRVALLRDGFDHAACEIDCDGAIAIRAAIPASV